MKLELIRAQLEQCEQALQAGQSQQAVEQACLTARLLLMRCAEWKIEDVQKTMIALVGVAGALQNRLDEAVTRQDPAELTAVLKKRIESIREDVAGTEDQYRQMVKLNQEILDEEERLRGREKELEDLRDKLKELISIKEEKLKKLVKATERQKKKLKQLETEYTECEALYKVVQTELEENLRILAELPDASGSDTLDQLIIEGKKTKDMLAAAAQSSSEPIRKIIGEIQRLRQLAEGMQ